ncbi:MAG: hypothetical protein WC570_01015 [Patescibacteria group bacterium]
MSLNYWVCTTLLVDTNEVLTLVDFRKAISIRVQIEPKWNSLTSVNLTPSSYWISLDSAVGLV